ncbi:MAG TPA: hypothetical protein VE779_14265 [Candidatus Angelobacter sp.]|jgi:hypothetical protein|nr:hypothetical protein [Candidatus Angelobacter sp.]
MSNLKYAIIEEEEVITGTVDSDATGKHPKPFVVSNTGKRGDNFTSRVEAALDLDFANGSMPA